MRTLHDVPRRGRRAFHRVLLALGLGVGALVVAAVPAGAHPLGNFTVNRYARVELSAGTVRVYYVLDEAELPAFEDRAAVSADRVAFASRRANEIIGNLRLVVDGSPLPLRVVHDDLSQPAGQGGLTTLRLALLLEGALPPGSPSAIQLATITDANEPARIGWREIVVTARGNAVVTGSTAPARDLSDELRHYPGNLVQAPLDLRSATFRFVPGSIAVPALPIAASTVAVTRYGGQFTSLITRQHLSPLVLLGMLAVALGFGAVHALAPGHGKTVMAAYLVGTRGRPRDAVLLGAIVSFMHTASVLVLGAALFQVSRSVAPDRVYPWLQLGSGLAIAVFGAMLLRSRRKALARPTATAVVRAGTGAGAVAAGAAAERILVGAGVGVGAGAHHDVPPGHDHSHDHDHSHGHDRHHDHGPGGHDHDHDRAHDHGVTHDHGPGGHSHELPEGVAPLSRRGLVVLATAGGLFPSPSALIVLIAAFTLGRAVLGLALIGAFSVGLAITLTAVGLAMVYGRAFAERKNILHTVRFLPIASACAIFGLGLLFAVEGLRSIH